jgi:hypothetical protein
MNLTLKPDKHTVRENKKEKQSKKKLQNNFFYEHWWKKSLMYTSKLSLRVHLKDSHDGDVPHWWSACLACTRPCTVKINKKWIIMRDPSWWLV